ncbi:hypothetical protein HanXRQr2_Chr04g0146621 [Helianthus annuus]|uniref:Uncharacterized protein n=1 Tax=Helianthus annuus TaxID=4232 RepID=A0A9K3J539_HELAN|nr:hypothetical protein HanXRQr2_Chr04g0146621 [Helianthus annuus]KAJ0929767.1 hypothetical protein HanPSC8_Chr04g0141401 [Helianthus annuus]
MISFIASAEHVGFHLNLLMVIASFDGNDPVDEDAASAAATTLFGKRLSYFEKTMLFMFQEISMIWSR